jgi:hypothetical protein
MATPAGPNSWEGRNAGGLRAGRGLTLPRHAQVAASAAITSTPNYPKRRAAFASAPSASSAAAGTCSIASRLTKSERQLPLQMALAGRGEDWSQTLLTVPSRVARILIILLPARTRLNIMSMPGARRNVCARRGRSSEPQAQGLYPGLNLKVLCSLPQSIRLDQKLRRNFPRIVDSVDHFGRERALP